MFAGRDQRSNHYATPPTVVVSKRYQSFVNMLLRHANSQQTSVVHVPVILLTRAIHVLHRYSSSRSVGCISVALLDNCSQSASADVAH